jgi:hypothetical protein
VAWPPRKLEDDLSELFLVRGIRRTVPRGTVTSDDPQGREYSCGKRSGWRCLDANLGGLGTAAAFSAPDP